MPLPSSVPRQELHLRRIELRGYRRVDGLYDLEAHRVDTKSEGLTVGGGRVVSPGEPVHDIVDPSRRGRGPQRDGRPGLYRRLAAQRLLRGDEHASVLQAIR